MGRFTAVSQDLDPTRLLFVETREVLPSAVDGRSNGPLARGHRTARPGKTGVRLCLDDKGQRLAAVPVVASGDHAVIHIGPPAATLWYELDIQ